MLNAVEDTGTVTTAVAPNGDLSVTPTPQPEPEEAMTAQVEPTGTPVAEEPKQATAVEIPLPGVELFRFAAGEPGWFIVDDSVMGGVSRSTVSFVPGENNDAGASEASNILNFSGIMSLDNNGGFSSVRSDWRPMDLSGTDGILLRVLGDGNVYRLRIRSTETGRNVTYNALFETSADTWQVVYVSYADMVPTRFGYTMNVGALDPATIASFGFMLSDKQPGQFDLAVDWVRAVTEAELQALVAERGG